MTRLEEETARAVKGVRNLFRPQLEMTRLEKDDNASSQHALQNGHWPTQRVVSVPRAPEAARGLTDAFAAS
jgi:hypothetical protein